ncbi:proly 4-hydroxylase [Thecamonas trahens ATCC 50062]|uniref:Proly 4-hydroxylase n=1 Tax=Thecamonas trahens ATCC 50062 TaxID=461836 RepID=A0A0L0D2C2_THETB|nr:proly 4-hydroxylase [Thecamonas trahens ATCC 50062]KNC46346.1 proly 4-hydroxylase [Thecamonas trahens ATCC 50062]|eukprot:XP_013760639.1 proly 4-hydroxylase [Thecamonas trahens ATCC 50062]
MAKVKGQGTESTTDSRDKVGMDGGGGRGRAVGVVEGRAEQEQGGHDGQAVKHIAEAKERQARLRVESRDEVCKGVTSSMRHRFVDDLRSLNSTEAWILGVLISIMVGLIVFLAYLGWFWAIGYNEATPDTRVLISPDDQPNESLSCEAITVHVHPNGGNNTGSPNDSAALKVVPCRETLFDVAHRGWAALGADAVGPNELRVFDGVGIQLGTLDEVVDGGHYYLVLAFEYWFWPGLYIGHVAVVPHLISPATGKPLEVETLALEPRLFLMRGFVSASEAEQVMAAANTTMKRSEVLDTSSSGSSTSKVSAVRTSSQAWLGWWTLVTWTLNARIEALTGVPSHNGERLQVIRYFNDQHYWAHHDYFDPAVHISRADLASGRNRMITVLFYLNDVEAGGATYFPRAAAPAGVGRGPLSSYTNCTAGVNVKPEPGAAIMFYSMHAAGHLDGALDVASLHGGCTVESGIKWGANRWLNNRRELQLLP